MRQTLALCQQFQLIGNRVRVHFQTDLIPALGQLVLARLSDTYDPYLRQPFFPSVIFETGFAVDFDQDDPALHLLSPGVTVDLIGPVGQAVPDLPTRSRVVLLADSDPAVLLPFAAQTIARGGTATLLLSARYPLEALKPEIELRVGSDLPALLAEFAPTADLVFIATDSALHKPLYEALAQARPVVSSELARALVSLPMPCGVGACYACSIKTAKGHRMACMSGPFFSLVDLNLQ
jgi:dihydroorotate dehydrogenase electron transfer subunit